LFFGSIQADFGAKRTPQTAGHPPFSPKGGSLPDTFNQGRCTNLSEPYPVDMVMSAKPLSCSEGASAKGNKKPKPTELGFLT